MTLRFPESPAFTDYDLPMRLEGSIRDLEVDDDIPAALQGAWYRCGPDPQYPPHRGDDVYVNGDGMLSMLRFGDGHVDFQSRYVRTERYLAERAARRSLFGDYRVAATDAPEVRGMGRGTANTTALWHGGRLFALKEDSLPYEVDPLTLETKGEYSWSHGLRARTFSAHPKIDPETGELWSFAYEAEGDGSSAMALIVVDRDGTLIREEWFEPPYVAMVHDFAITRDHVLFPIFPTLMDPARLQAGGPHWMNDAARDAWLGVMPRGGTVADLRWFRRPGGHSYHVINAFSEGSRVHLDLALSQINSFPFIPDVSGAPYDPRLGAPIPMRWTVDMDGNGDGIEERPLGRIPGDLPRIDDRRIGQPYRYAYLGLVDPSRALPKAGPVGAGFNLLGCLDTQTEETAIYYGDDETSFQEPQFVPGGPDEQDGFILTVMNRHDQNRADIGIFAASDIAAGPVATVRLPIRLRLAFHGCWVPEAELPK